MDSTVTEQDAPDASVLSERAIARGLVTMRPETARAIAANEIKKGDVLAAARFAAVQAAKEAESFLPLIDPASVRRVAVDFDVREGLIEVTVDATCSVEQSARLRALSAATAATLTIYDMCKSADRSMQIGPVSLVAPPFDHHPS